MSVETVAKNLPPQFIHTKLIDRFVITMVINDLPRFIESIPINLPRAFEQEFAEKMHNQAKGVVPIIVASHTSHMDALPLAKTAKMLVEINHCFSDINQLQGFVIPVASSMATGHQGSVVKEGTERMQQIVSQKYHLEAVPYTRHRDTEKYGLKRDNNVSSMLNLVRKVKERHGIAIFPEATMQAGRIKKNGLPNATERYGMQEFKDMEGITRIVSLAGKEPLYIPVGIDGGFRLESPDNNRPTLAYLGEIFLSRPAETKLVSVRVGLPITREGLGDQNINDFLGKKVAMLLPQEARGVYA